MPSDLASATASATDKNVSTRTGPGLSTRELAPSIFVEQSCAIRSRSSIDNKTLSSPTEFPPSLSRSITEPQSVVIVGETSFPACVCSGRRHASAPVDSRWIPRASELPSVYGTDSGARMFPHPMQPVLSLFSISEQVYTFLSMSHTGWTVALWAGSEVDGPSGPNLSRDAEKRIAGDHHIDRSESRWSPFCLVCLHTASRVLRFLWHWIRPYKPRVRVSHTTGQGTSLPLSLHLGQKAEGVDEAGSRLAKCRKPSIGGSFIRRRKAWWQSRHGPFLNGVFVLRTPIAQTRNSSH